MNNMIRRSLRLASLVASFSGLLLFSAFAQAQPFQIEGPQPILGTQAGSAGGEQVGAINAIAAHPTDPDILYIGAVNGGVWKTTNATAATPTWFTNTDDQQSLSIYDLSFDLTDATSNTLAAGMGTTSSLGGIGGDRAGVLLTTDGGDTWTLLNNGILGSNISGVAPRGTTIVATADTNDGGFACAQTGVFRSTDSGASFVQVTDGIGAGSIDSLASDPSDPTTLFVSLVANDCPGSVSGIYESNDTVASWTKVSDAAIDSLLVGDGDTIVGGDESTHVEMSVGNSNNLYVAIVTALTPGAEMLSGLFRSGDGGGSFTALDLPITMETVTPGGALVPQGLHPGGQGNIHTSIAADPVDTNVVYIAGDRQPGANADGANGPPFPNSSGATAFSARIFRVDASLPTGSQAAVLTDVPGTANNTTIHPDSRDMMFNAAGDLLESDDGGIYRRTSPQDNTGDWFSVNGTLQIAEVHSADYDTNADVIGGGLQDNSQGAQNATGDLAWTILLGGDGGDFDIDNLSLAGVDQSIRYTSAQTLLAFNRFTYDDLNVLQSVVGPALTPLDGAPACMAGFVNTVAINSQDGTRLVFACTNGIYESLDQGDTISLLPNDTGIPLVRDFAFGFEGISAGAPGNPEQLFIADGISDAVYRRLTAGAPLEVSFSDPDVAVIAAVTQDDEDASQLFFIDLDDGVFRTTDTGDNWVNVNGNLLTEFAPGRIWAITYASNPLGTGDAVIVGTDRGVFIASENSGFTEWSSFGTGFPNAVVFTLRYEAELNQLFASTLGRGTLSAGPVFNSLSEEFFVDGFESID